MWDHLRTPPFQRRKGLALQSSWGQLSWMLPASFTQQLCGQYTGLLRVCHLISYFTVTLMRCSSHGGTCLLGPTERPQYHDDLECWGCKKGRAFLGPPPNQEEAPQAQKDPWLSWLPGIKGSSQTSHPGLALWNPWPPPETEAPGIPGDLCPGPALRHGSDSTLLSQWGLKG